MSLDNEIFRHYFKRLEERYGKKSVPEELIEIAYRKFRWLTGEELQELITQVIANSRFAPTVRTMEELGISVISKARERQGREHGTILDCCHDGWIHAFKIEDGTPTSFSCPKCDLGIKKRRYSGKWSNLIIGYTLDYNKTVPGSAKVKKMTQEYKQILGKFKAIQDSDSDDDDPPF